MIDPGLAQGADPANRKNILNSDTYKIGELADLAQSTTRTLRYYEELGLLEAVRNDAGQRLYNGEALARLQFIHELKSGGFSLQEIAQFFKSWRQNTGAEATESTMKIVQQKMTEIADLQKRLNKLNNELHAIVNYLVACRTCDLKPSAHACTHCDRHEDDRQPPSLLLNLLQKKDERL